MHSILVNVTSHPALHNFMTDTNEWDAEPGTMWPIRAFSGSSGIASLQSCVDCTLEPFGMVTVSGFRAGTISLGISALLDHH